MPEIKHVLLLAVSIAACTSSPAGPQNDGPPPPAIPLKNAQSASYTIGVTVGGSQTFDVIVDTGSTTLGIAGSDCPTCMDISPVYTPGASAMDVGSAASSAYAIGGWTGEIYSDSVALTDDSIAPMNMKLVDISEEENTFGTQDVAQGILGFGPPTLEVAGTDAYVTERINAGDSGVFAIQMCDYNGTMWFGGADKTHEASAEQYTALAPFGADHPYYEVDIASASIGGTSINLSGEAVPDTGTTMMGLPTASANAFRDAINSNPGFGEMFVGQTFQLATTGTVCLATAHTRAEIDAALPEFAVTFADLDGNPFTLELPATESYLLPFGKYYCAVVGDAFADVPITILGDAFLRSFVSVFDPVNGKIGFAPQQGCVTPSEAREPLPTHFVPYVHGHPMSSVRGMGYP